MEFLQNKVITSILIVIAFWLGSYILTALMRLLEKATNKTDTDIDDKIIKAAKLPVRYLLVLLGFFFGFVLAWVIDKSGVECPCDQLNFTSTMLLSGRSALSITFRISFGSRARTAL